MDAFLIEKVDSSENCDFQANGEKKILRKEVIHPQIPLGTPCYDLVLVTNLTFVPSVIKGPSGAADFADLTGGEYKTRERIHRDVADSRLLPIPTS